MDGDILIYSMTLAELHRLHADEVTGGFDYCIMSDVRKDTDLCIVDIDAKVAVVASKTVVALTELNTTAEAVKRKLSCADVGRLGLAMKVWEPTPDVVPELDTNILDGGLGHAL